MSETKRTARLLANATVDREEAKREEDFSFTQDYDEDEEDEEWEGEGDWNNEGDETEDVKDESTAYLEFLNEEVSSNTDTRPTRAQLTTMQAQKFNVISDDDDDELEEESLLETPLDKLEPYGLFKGTLQSEPCPGEEEKINANQMNRTPTGAASAVRDSDQGPEPGGAAGRAGRGVSSGSPRRRAPEPHKWPPRARAARRIRRTLLQLKSPSQCNSGTPSDPPPARASLESIKLPARPDQTDGV